MAHASDLRLGTSMGTTFFWPNLLGNINGTNLDLNSDVVGEIWEQCSKFKRPTKGVQFLRRGMV
jgi:hypothetical protein